MARLYLFGEGRSEQEFAHNTIAPHLAAFGIDALFGIRISNSTKKGTRGGGRNYEAMKLDISNTLKRHKSADVFFTTMIDLYALAHDFPGSAEAEKLGHLPYGRIAVLEDALAAEFADPRFVPHIQLHEFETMLFCDPSQFGSSAATNAQIQAIIELAARYPNPELIDEGQHSAPSKRIEGLFPEYRVSHGRIGPKIAQLIGLPAIRAKCPHFDAWITKLESLRPLAPSPDMPLHPAPTDV